MSRAKKKFKPSLSNNLRSNYYNRVVTICHGTFFKWSEELTFIIGTCKCLIIVCTREKKKKSYSIIWKFVEKKKKIQSILAVTRNTCIFYTLDILGSFDVGTGKMINLGTWWVASEDAYDIASGVVYEYNIINADAYLHVSGVFWDFSGKNWRKLFGIEPWTWSGCCRWWFDAVSVRSRVFYTRWARPAEYRSW